MPQLSPPPGAAVACGEPVATHTLAISQRVVSVHFPKAAGSSLKFQFQKLLGDQVLLDYSSDPLVDLNRQRAEFPPEKTLVHGHFHPARYASAQAYRLTFLRHPVDNLISIYFYWKSLAEPGHALHAQFLHERPSVLEFTSYPGIGTLMSETYFGHFDMRQFDFIGFYETRSADLQRLADDLGVPLQPEVYMNETSEMAERRELEADISLRRRLTDLLAADVAFYDRLRCVA